MNSNMESMKNKKTGEPSAAAKPTVYQRVKKGLGIVSQAIIAAPVKLPPKVVTVAKYVALALGMLEAVEGATQKGADDED